MPFGIYELACGMLLDKDLVTRQKESTLRWKHVLVPAYLRLRHEARMSVPGIAGARESRRVRMSVPVGVLRP